MCLGFALLELISADNVSADLITYRVVDSNKFATNICPYNTLLSVCVSNTLTPINEGLARPYENTGSRFVTNQCAYVYMPRKASSSFIPVLHGDHNVLQREAHIETKFSAGTKRLNKVGYTERCKELVLEIAIC